MKRNHIIIVVLIIIAAIIFFTKSQENAGSVFSSSGTTNFNTEAVQNIASVYSESTSGTASFNNLRVTKDLTVNGNFNVIPKV